MKYMNTLRGVQSTKAYFQEDTRSRINHHFSKLLKKRIFTALDHEDIEKHQFYLHAIAGSLMLEYHLSHDHPLTGDNSCLDTADCADITQAITALHSGDSSKANLKENVAKTIESNIKGGLVKKTKTLNAVLSLLSQPADSSNSTATEIDPIITSKKSNATDNYKKEPNASSTPMISTVGYEAGVTKRAIPTFRKEISRNKSNEQNAEIADIAQIEDSNFHTAHTPFPVVNNKTNSIGSTKKINKIRGIPRKNNECWINTALQILTYMYNNQPCALDNDFKYLENNNSLLSSLNEFINAYTHEKSSITVEKARDSFIKELNKDPSIELSNHTRDALRNNQQDDSSSLLNQFLNHFGQKELSATLSDTNQAIQQQIYNQYIIDQDPKEPKLYPLYSELPSYRFYEILNDEVADAIKIPFRQNPEETKLPNDYDSQQKYDAVMHVVYKGHLSPTGSNNLDDYLQKNNGHYMTIKLPSENDSSCLLIDDNTVTEIDLNYGTVQSYIEDNGLTIKGTLFEKTNSPAERISAHDRFKQNYYFSNYLTLPDTLENVATDNNISSIFEFISATVKKFVDFYSQHTASYQITNQIKNDIYKVHKYVFEYVEAHKRRLVPSRHQMLWGKEKRDDNINLIIRDIQHHLAIIEQFWM